MNNFPKPNSSATFEDNDSLRLLESGFPSRRNLLTRMGTGLGMLGMVGLLSDEGRGPSLTAQEALLVKVTSVYVTE